MLDPSFLELVRLGVLRPDDPRVLNTLTLVDQYLGYSTPNGPFWHRASFDGYGETADGSEWQPTPTGSGITHGRGWPLLTGERGEYQLAAGSDAQNYLDTMARSADNASLAAPGTGVGPPAPGGYRAGLPTGRADLLCHPARLDARAVHPARVVHRQRRADRDPATGRLPLLKPDLRPLTLTDRVDCS